MAERTESQVEQGRSTGVRLASLAAAALLAVLTGATAVHAVTAHSAAARPAILADAAPGDWNSTGS